MAMQSFGPKLPLMPEAKSTSVMSPLVRDYAAQYKDVPLADFDPDGEFGDTESGGGYRTIRNPHELAAQHLKMLLLTIPGERMMKPAFGVGMAKYLWSKDHHTVHGQIESDIRSQVSRYLPYIDILNIDFSSSRDSDFLLNIAISYFVKALSARASLGLTPGTSPGSVVASGDWCDGPHTRSSTITRADPSGVHPRSWSVG